MSEPAFEARAPVLSPTIFREYDVRGRVPEIFPEAVAELSDEGMQRLGRGFGTLVREEGQEAVLVAHDLRTYSPRLRDCFVEGLLRTGLTVLDMGCALTPMLYFATVHQGCPAGAVITASHNPQGWSGLKLTLEGARTLLRPDLERLQARCESGPFARGAGRRETLDLKEAWTQDLTRRIALARPLRVVLDPGNGTAALFCREVFARAGMEVVPLFCDPDPTFPNHFPNPSDVAARTVLAREVLDREADLGLSFDGDGDRLGVHDHEGTFVNADRVLMILAREVLARRPGAPIVFDVKCTQALIDEVRARGGRPVMWKTGHSWIKAKMREVNAPLAGERSGHIFFGEDFHGYDDAIFAGLKLCEAVAQDGRSLRDMLAAAPSYVTSPEIHADCSDERKYAVLEDLVAALRSRYGDRVDTTNGARVTFDDGWGLVRASSNLPQLVLVFEGRTESALRRIKATFRELLATQPDVGTSWHNE